MGNQRVTWEKYVEAICYRFGGQQNPLEELMELKQLEDLKGYIQDFDILWNKAKISKKTSFSYLFGRSGERNRKHSKNI